MSKNIPIRRIQTSRPFWIVQMPFCRTKFPFSSSEEPFSKNSFILDKKGGLKSEIQINLSNIHFPFWYLMGIIYSPNDSWSQKTRAHITFMKNLASWVTLSILSKILIWNKMTFLASNSLKLAGLAVNQLKRTHQKYLPIFIFIYNFVEIIIAKI